MKIIYNKMTLTQTIGRIVRSQSTKLVKIFAGGEVIMATPEHPIYESTNGWTLAGNLRKGMSLLLATGLSLSIDSVAAIDTSCTVYNCDVPVTHTYYIGNNAILAHNADVCNKLIEAVLNKLGKGYDAAGVKAGLENIFSKYKLLKTNLTDQQIIEDLAKLCSGNVSPTELSKLLSYVGDDLSKAGKFAEHSSSFGFLDELGNDGIKISAYVDIEKDINKSFGLYNEYRKAKVLFNTEYKKFFSYLGNKTGIAKDVWKTYATQVENLMATKIAELKTLYPNAKIGYSMLLPNFRTESWLISDRELTKNNQKATKAFLLFFVG